MESGSRSVDERRGFGVPPVVGSPGAVPAASGTRLDRQDRTGKVDHRPYGHSSGGTRMVARGNRESALTGMGRGVNLY